jgi:hypothetical protein
MYLAVDLALVTDVLPDADKAAKDFGVCNMANALPYAFAPGRVAGHPRRQQRQPCGAVFRCGACAFLRAVAVVSVKTVR